MKRKRSTAAGHEIVYSYNQFDCIVGNFMNDHQAKGWITDVWTTYISMGPE